MYKMTNPRFVFLEVLFQKLKCVPIIFQLDYTISKNEFSVFVLSEQAIVNSC